MTSRLRSPSAARLDAPNALHGRAGLVLRLCLVGLALSVSACQRGCLSAWMTEQAGSPGAPGEGARRSSDREAGGFELGGTDCSGGLARCAMGRVETSVAGHVPHPCIAREQSGGCGCRWQPAGQCAAGCVEEGLEVVAAADVARVQLCAPAEPALRALLPHEITAVSICADESASCVDGLVRTCAGPGQPVRLLAGCVAGCATGISVEPGDALTNDGAAAILCRRAHAERR